MKNSKTTKPRILRHDRPKEGSKLARGNEKNMELKMEYGFEALGECLEKVNATELVEIKRKNGAK